MTRILIIDPQFADTPDIEAAAAGADIVLDVLRPGIRPVEPDALREADAIVNCRSRHTLPEACVAAMDRTKIVVQAGVGFNHIDVEACARRGIPVCNTPDYGTMEVADHAVALALTLIRGTAAYDERLRFRDGAWSTLALPLPPVRRLSGLVFGIVGLGRIGTAVARRMQPFGVRIVFFDPFVPPGQELAMGLDRAATLPALLGLADVLSLHCPLTERTVGLVNDGTVAQMKQGVVLLNTARGGVVDLDAVEAGLRSGRIGAAGLDVLAQEPPDLRHPLLAAWQAREPWLEGRLIVTPHAAFYTPESLADMRRLSMAAAAGFLRDGTLRACVNGRELERHGFRFDG